MEIHSAGVFSHNGHFWVIGQNVLVVNPKNKQEMNRIYVILTTQ